MENSKQKTIPIFIGYDYRERAAANVLIDSLYQNSSSPLSITPLITEQLLNKGFHNRLREEKQSTDFSFTRFLVPYLMNYDGWAIFLDCDMLCQADITKLWDQRNNKFSLMCVKHDHIPKEKKKFLGEIQTAYPKKNWSSLMLMNCQKCKKLSINYVNKASGLDLHRFNWLPNDNQVGEIIGDGWNYLVGVNEEKDVKKLKKKSLIHWTLGGPWFNGQKDQDEFLSSEWFKARDRIIKLWN
tara:strand:- start:16 stop:738 length:723 start_codon:yes stop_codon:yes gene_type:complete